MSLIKKRNADLKILIYIRGPAISPLSFEIGTSDQFCKKIFVLNEKNTKLYKPSAPKNTFKRGDLLLLIRCFSRTPCKLYNTS